MKRIKQIFDGEYGCEERTADEKAKVLVILENETGQVMGSAAIPGLFITSRP